jgi:hypothetical protein
MLTDLNGQLTTREHMCNPILDLKFYVGWNHIFDFVLDL